MKETTIRLNECIIYRSDTVMKSMSENEIVFNVCNENCHKWKPKYNR